jgi:AraC-like DNA-binding protein
LIKTGLKTLNIYYCGSEKCKAGHFFGPAIRPHYLIHFIRNGKGIYQVGNKTYQLNKGEAFLIMPNEITYYQADKNDPWEYAWAAFDGEESEQLLQAAGFMENNLVCSIHDLDACGRYLEKMIEKFQNSGYHEYELIGLFYLTFSTIVNPKHETEKIPEMIYLDRALAYIRQNYSYDINVTDIARYVGIDRTYLYKIFKKHKGMSIKTYLLEYRILKAKDMLHNTEYNMTEIALSCGFSDLPSFCRVFRQFEGTTPTSYRNQQLKNGPKIYF